MQDSRMARPYQVALKNAVRSAFCERDLKGVVCEAFTGAGKGFSIADIAKDVILGDLDNSVTGSTGNVLIAVNRDNLCNQLYSSLEREGLHPMMEKGLERALINQPSLFGGYRHKDCIVASIQSIQNERLLKFHPNHFELVIADECFPADTEIKTPNGPTLIQSIVPGCLVFAFSHQSNLMTIRKVLKMRISWAYSLLEIRLKNGVVIQATDNHPFFDGEKYIPAKELTADSKVHCISGYAKQSSTHSQNIAMQELRNRCNLHEREQKKGYILRYTGFLKKGLCILLSWLQGCWPRRGEPQMGNGESANEEGGMQSQAISYNESHGVEACDSRWKRNPSPGASITTGVNIRMGNRACSEDGTKKEFRVSTTLQIRHREQCFENRSGDRWSESRIDFQARTGQKEGEAFELVGVESIKVLEFSSEIRPPQMRSGRVVYNLEVEEDNNFFANGALVHNCHFGASDTFLQVLNHFKSAYHIGVTATLERHDKKGLWSGYQECVFCITMQEGINEGWLVPYDVVELPVPIDISIKDAGKKMWTEEDEQKALSSHYIEIFKAALPHLPGNHSLMFWNNCKSSMVASAYFSENGVESKHVEGPGGPARMSPDQIKDILGWFSEPSEQGKNLNCADLLSYGYDCPPINVLGLMRVTRSIPMTKQRAGRATRPDCVVDGLGSRPARLAAIAASRKPRWKLLDLMIQVRDMEHSFATASSLITSDHGEMRILDRARKGKSMSMEELDGKIKASRESGSNEGALSKLSQDAANAAMRAQSKTKGPYIGDIFQRYPAKGVECSDKQWSYLVSLGCKLPRDGVTKLQAVHLINRYKQYNERNS